MIARIVLTLGMASAATVAAATNPPPPPPLAPSSKWNVDYGDTACLLGRQYGEGKAQTLLVFRQLPLSDRIDVMVQIKSYRDQFLLGNATFTVDGASVGEGRFEAFPTKTRGVRTAIIGSESDLRARLPDKGVFAVWLGRDAPMAFTLQNTRAAFAALDTCNKAILKTWGVDPAESERISTPPEPLGKQQNWIGPEDYPKDVVARGAQGTTILLWTIGVDGRISGCRAVVTSGIAELDKAACDALTRRGRYSPAIGTDGKPHVAHQTQRIVWRLPNWQGSPKREAPTRESSQ